MKTISVIIKQTTLLTLSVFLCSAFISKAQTMDASFYDPDKPPSPALPENYMTRLGNRCVVAGFGFEINQEASFLGSFQYLMSPDKQRKYFLGFGFTASKREETDHRSHNGRAGEFHNKRMSVSLDLVQKYFFNSGKKTVPFVGLNVGLRSFNQNVYLEYKTPLIPFFLPIPVTASDSIYENQQHGLSVALTYGLFFNLDSGKGITTAMDIRFAKPHDTFTEPSKATFIACLVAVQITADKNKKRNRYK